MGVRVTQESLEAVQGGSPHGRTAQAAAEVLQAPATARGRASQAALEVLQAPASPGGRAAQVVLEVLTVR